MMISFWCVFIVALLPYCLTIIAKSKKDYAKYNHEPRVFLENLTGFRQRSSWAAKNTFECFPFFASAVIIAHLSNQVNISLLNILSVSFVILRVIYGFLYIFNFASLRSLFWLLAIILNMVIFIVAI